MIEDQGIVGRLYWHSLVLAHTAMALVPVAGIVLAAKERQYVLALLAAPIAALVLLYWSRTPVGRVVSVGPDSLVVRSRFVEHVLPFESVSRAFQWPVSFEGVYMVWIVVRGRLGLPLAYVVVGDRRSRLLEVLREEGLRVSGAAVVW